MRRLKILFYWLFVSKNNVSLKELIYFIFKPTIGSYANKVIQSCNLAGDEYIVKFNNTPHTLFWPKKYSLTNLQQIISETFDSKDWHFYQKEHTTIESGEIILDIGTAEGLFPLTVIDKCTKVIIVEPNKIFIKSLKKSFSNYLDKVEILNYAVGNQSGVINFSEDSLEGQVTADCNNQIQIEKIDNLIPQDQKISYLKADIEGFELEMLKGAAETIKRNKPKIAITTYHKENDYKEMILLIKSFVPEYKYYYKGIYEEEPKPVMLHFWI